MESPLQDEFHEELHSQAMPGQHFDTDTLGMSSFIFILAAHVRLRLASDCLHLRPALRHASIRKCQCLRSHTLKTWRLQSLPARILICQVPSLMFVSRGMACHLSLSGQVNLCRNGHMHTKGCGTVSACQSRPPAQRCQEYPNVVSNATFS